ncbi:hypothetical protein PGTUg99_026517 [Puccinia graminis f. sp. tritici]|uniref:CxC1-like cysteine cluster associated with KDZ transposases domain-containing protein n=1 Tax=Puccinia graminis f. sp. tritici TaxID=56615 RepID=A0A5B0M9V2_PUCGR|nr:hypothetical protein PGTUg99_026517 [Puccinia graminis f. sp. tritici]
MGIRKPSKKNGGSLSQRLRRQANSAFNQSAFHRLQTRPTGTARAEQIPGPSEGEENNSYEPSYQENSTNFQDDSDSETNSTNDERTTWVTLPPGDESEQIDGAIESARERYRILAKDYNWKALIKQMHPQYIILQLRTKNWAAPNAYQEFTAQCACPLQHKTSRLVDLVDVYESDFCHCQLDAVRLLRRGFIAGSPMSPQTAFSLPLLTLHNELWNHCHISVLPFTLALTQWLEPRSERLCAKNQQHARDMRKPFSAAVDMFRLLEEKTAVLIEEVLQLNDQEILAGRTCPACFGPQPSNSADYPESTRDRLIVCLDGNFQHRHNSQASRDYEALRSPHIFLPEGASDKMTREIRNMELVNQPPNRVGPFIL